MIVVLMIAKRLKIKDVVRKISLQSKENDLALRITLNYSIE